MRQIDLSGLKLSSSCDTDILKLYFSEEEIFRIQEFFLNAGFHCIKLSNFNIGKILIRALLKFFQNYKRIAILTLASWGSSFKVYDLYRDSDFQDVLMCKDGALEDFLLNSFYYDVLVVEVSDELLSEPWYGRLEGLLVEFNFVSTLPVINFVYV